jgi:hypothetical protein
MISQISPSYSPNMGEALATHLAVSLAFSLGLDCFILKGDSEVVFLALRHPNSSSDWRISSIIDDIIDSIPFSSSWEARNVNRSANFYVHYIAH